MLNTNAFHIETSYLQIERANHLVTGTRCLDTQHGGDNTGQTAKQVAGRSVLNSLL